MRRIGLYLLLALLLTACAAAAGDPAAAVENYLAAKLAADRDTMSPLLCSALESSLEAEAASFANVEAKLEEPACTRIANTDTVQCGGAIVVNYGAEDTRLPLSTYRIVQEDGEWHWCGEAG